MSRKDNRQTPVTEIISKGRYVWVNYFATERGTYELKAWIYNGDIYLVKSINRKPETDNTFEIVESINLTQKMQLL